MSLTACQLYMKGLLDGLENPQLDPLTAVIQPPVIVDTAVAPVAFVWAGRAPIRRQTAPRAIRIPAGGIKQGGYQTANWDVAVRLFVVMAQEDPTIETAFPALVDACILELTTTPIPTIQTDPVTGQQFQILMVGEKIDVDYATAKATVQSQGIIRFGCDLIVGLKEKLAPSEGVP